MRQDHHQKEPPAVLDPVKVSAGFARKVDGLVSSYFKVQQGLSRDDLKGAASGAKEFLSALGSIDTAGLNDTAHRVWMAEDKNMKPAAGKIAGAKDIAHARNHFVQLSDSLYVVVKRFGTAGDQNVLRFFCPMARDNKGAHWLQFNPETENPYYGSMMYRCGSQVEVLTQKTVGKEKE